MTIVTRKTRPPNILLILFDKCRTDAIGVYGEQEIETPNLDALAKDGIRFSHCYTPQALCGPARASILTGSYPHSHGLRRNVYPVSPSTIHSNYQEPISDPFRDSRFRLWDNFPYLLNNAGYATAHVGKWHLGPANPGFFDYWKSFNSMLRHWIGEPHQSFYRPDVHTDQGIRFIERHAAEPFFLYQSYYVPHEPLDPPQRFLRHYRHGEHREYYASVINLDWNVGRLVKSLRRLDLLDETLVIVTSDHGRTWIDRPGSLEGMCVSYEDSARVPLIMRYPSLLPRGQVWHSGVSLVDLMPTILEAAGIQPILGVEPQESRPLIQGESLISSVNSQEDDWTRPMVIENIPMRTIDGSDYDERALRTKRHKLILRKFCNPPHLRPGELYDLDQDPQEMHNLYGSSSHQEIRKKLAKSLQKWGQDTQDDLALELGSWALVS